MSYEIIMPKLGLTMKAGTLVRWLKKEGDAVSDKEPVIEIETEKLSYSIESPAAGVVLKRLAIEGEKYAVACVLGYVGYEGEELPAKAKNRAAPFSVAGKPGGAGGAVGLAGSGGAASLAGASGVAGFAGSGGAGGVTIPAGATGVVASAFATGAAVPAASIPGGRVFITPVAKKLAAERGIDYRQIPGSGPNGRILKADVLRFCEQQAAVRDAQPDGEVIPYAGMRRSIGDNMTAAWNAAPMVTYQVSVDVSKLVAFRSMLNNGVAEKSKRVSINDLLLKLTATALRDMPAMNATITDAGIIRHNHINIGMATAISNGLVVPVIHDADSKSLLSISREAGDLAARARSGELMPDEVHGGTFTVTNLGAYNSVDFFTPIVNMPEVGVLGVGRIVPSPVAINGRVKIRSMLGLSLTCDHRVIDGTVAAEFLQLMMRLLENPARAVM